MNRAFVFVAAVAAALGFWGGISAWHSGGIGTTISAASAILLGVILLSSIWLWRRAQPGSGDAMHISTLILLGVSLLLGVLPRLFWRGAENLQLAGSIASVLVMTVMLVRQIRYRRRLRRST